MCNGERGGNLVSRGFVARDKMRSYGSSYRADEMQNDGVCFMDLNQEEKKREIKGLGYIKVESLTDLFSIQLGRKSYIKIL